MGITDCRITGSTHALLRQLAQPDALIVFATTRIEGEPRFYFQKRLAHFIVKERSVDVLVSNGFLLRTGCDVPVYRITVKGRSYLKLMGERP